MTTSPQKKLRLVIHGCSVAVDALVRWAQHGPELACVERVEIGLDDGNYNGFEAIR